MKLRIAEIEIHIAAVIDVAVVLLRTNECRLWEKGPVIVTAGVFFAVRKPGDMAFFIAPDTLLAGPQWERFATQIEIRELLAAAVDMVFGFGSEAQPDTVMAGVIAMQFQL